MISMWRYGSKVYNVKPFPIFCRKVNILKFENNIGIFSGNYILN